MSAFLRNYTDQELRMIAYSGIGVVFGGVNWVFPDYQYLLTQPFGGPQFDPTRATIADAVALLSWIVPLIAISLFETTRSRRPLHAALAGLLFWLSACASYYALYLGQFLIGGVENSGIVTDGGIREWFNTVMLIRPWSHVGSELALWTMAALYGAPVISALVSRLTLQFTAWRGNRAAAGRG